MTTEHAEWDLAEGKMITETTTNIAITIWDGEARVLSPPTKYTVRSFL